MSGCPANSILRSYFLRSGGGRIRTSDAGIGGVAVFDTAALNHSATPPGEKIADT
jgi:hypothetical protein